MLQIQSGPRLPVRSQFKPLRRFTAAAYALCIALVALAAPFAARAQAQVPPALETRPDPLNARASVPPLVHESAFAQYRRLSDVPVGSWRDANDTVSRIGGWRVYAREAAQPASAASVPAGAASAPGMKPADPAKAAPKPAGKDPHAGHKMN